MATPIGNLEDITLRALRILKEADTILCEDTRRTRILCTKFDINKRLESYHIFNEHGRTPELIRRIQSGEKIALVSDAGMPCIADPGFLLVREAVEAGIEPEIVPGASAVIFSIAASALPSDRFAFHGFLPVKSGRRSTRLAEIAASNMTAVGSFGEQIITELPPEMEEETLQRLPRYDFSAKVHAQKLLKKLGFVR